MQPPDIYTSVSKLREKVEALNAVAKQAAAADERWPRLQRLPAAIGEANEVGKALTRRLAERRQ